MALIKCPECRKNVSEEAKKCVHCGCSLTADNVPEYKTEKTASEDGEFVEAKKRKAPLLLVLGAAAVLCVGVFLWRTNSKKISWDTVEKIAHEEIGWEKLEITKCVYNKEENKCVIFFEGENGSDIGTVDLTNKQAGCQTVFDAYSALSDLTYGVAIMDGTISDDEQDAIQKLAQEILDYPYDVFLVYDLEVNGYGNKWEDVYP